MSIEVKRNQENCEFIVTDEMTIYTASQMKKAFLDNLDGCRNVEVSLEHVGEMDSAGLQLMLMLSVEAKRQDIELHFTRHSAAVIDVLETLNLVAHFADPIVIPAGGSI